MRTIDYALAVVREKEACGAIRPSTAHDYRKSLLAWPGHVRRADVRDLDRAALVEAVAEMRSRVSSNTARKRFAALNMVLAHALALGEIEMNPLATVPKPRMERPEKNPLVGYDLERVKQMLAAMGPHGWATAAALCLYAGLRSEEACALRWSDVDLGEGSAAVRSAVGIGSGGAYLSGTKTGASRDVPVCDELARLLARRRRADPGPWVTGGARWANPSVVGRKWSALCEVEGWAGLAGRRPTLHDLRHTFATACVRGGMDVMTLQSILGHSSAAVTLDVYASADPGARREARGLIGRCL